MDALDRFIAQLYQGAAQLHGPRFQQWALQNLQVLLPFDAALWGRGRTDTRDFHTVTTLGVSQGFGEALAAYQDINPLLPELQAHPCTSFCMSDVLEDEVFFASALYEKCFQPYGIKRNLSISYYEPRSGLYTLLSFYRREADAKFSTQERLLQQRLLYHMVQAASQAYFMYLQFGELKPHRHHSALCDQHGYYHQVQPGFFELLDRHCEEDSAGRLPFALPKGGQVYTLSSLCVAVEPMDDVYLVKIWPAGPLDQLTSQERRVVDQVCQGLSFKAIGQRLGIAPSTAANHLYNAYRKMGVASRQELVKIVHGY